MPYGFILRKMMIHWWGSTQNSLVLRNQAPDKPNLFYQMSKMKLAVLVVVARVSGLNADKRVVKFKTQHHLLY